MEKIERNSDPELVKDIIEETVNSDSTETYVDTAGLDRFELKRKRAAEKRKKELQRKLIFLGAELVVLILVLLFARIVSTKKKDAQSQGTKAVAETESVLQTEQDYPTPVASSVEEVYEYTPSDAPNSESMTPPPLVSQASESTQSYSSADRSNFAVQPGVPCGIDHNNGVKTVYLTLDDGPSSITAEVLDCLDRYGAKATFFVTAQDPDYFYMIKEAYDRGHTIGLHSYSHNYEYIYSSPEAYFDDLNKIGQVVKDQIGYVPAFIRFPGGAANWISRDYCMGIMTTLTQEVVNRGYQYFDWNCSTGDGDGLTDVNELIRLGTSCDYTNVILLGHDADDKRSTLEALPGIIEHYQSLGYVFKGIDRDTFYCHGNVRN